VTLNLFGLARDRNARLFLSVTLTAGFGSSAMSLAASVWVLSLTGSGSLAALCGFAVFLPSLFGPVIGTAVDRLPRKRLIVGTNVALALLLLVLLTVQSRAQLWLIFAVMLGYGVGHVLIDAGESALLQLSVPSEGLGRLNSLRTSVQEGMKLVAPLAGAGLFTALGGGSVAVLAAVALLIAAWLYTRIRVHGSAAGGTRLKNGVLKQTLEGLRFLAGDARLRPVVAIAALAVAVSGLANAASYVVITADLHRPAAFAGVLAAAQGAGSIVSGILGGRMLERAGERATAAWGATLYAIGSMMASTPSVLTVACGRMVVGLGLPWTVVAAFTAVQRQTPNELIGRVSAGAGTFIFGSTALAIPLGAGLIEIVDHRLVLVGSALLTLALISAQVLADHPHQRR
jgi:MFS family permease